MIQQENSKLVVAVLRRGKQRTPAITCGLIDVSARCQKNTNGLDVIRTSGVNHRGQFPAVDDIVSPATATTEGSGCRVVALLILSVVRRTGIVRRSRSSTTSSSSPPAATTSTRRGTRGGTRVIRGII